MERLEKRVSRGAYSIGIKGKGKAAPVNFVLDIHGANKIDYPSTWGHVGSPADARGSLSVGAVNWNSDTIASYSSRGPTEDGRVKPDISAPSGISNVVYKGAFHGTSAAAPHVAGAAALVWGRQPSLSRNDVASILLSRAKDLGAPGPDNEYGVGRLDLGDPSAALVPRPGMVELPRVPPPTTPSEPEKPGTRITIPWRTIATVLALGAAGSVAWRRAPAWLRALRREGG